MKRRLPLRIPYSTLPLLCILALLMVQITLSAQISFQLGYGMGNLGNSMNEFRNEVHYLNNVSFPNHSEALQHGAWVKGLSIGYQIGGDEIDKPYFFMNWSNEHLVAAGNLNNAAYSLKYRHNNFDIMGFGYRLSKHLGVGFCPTSIGCIKVLKKEGDGDYTAYYNVTKGILGGYTSFGGSVHLDFILTNKLWIRTGYYFDYAPVALRDLELTEHVYGASRFKFQVNYYLHKD